MKVKIVSRNLLREAILLKCWRYIIVVSILLVNSLLSSVFILDAYKEIVAQIINQQDDLIKYIIQILCTSFIVVVLGYIKNSIVQSLTVSSVAHIEDAALRHIANLETWQTDYDAGKLLPTISNDIESLVTEYIGYTMSIISLISGIIFTSIYALQISTTIYCICLVAILIIYYITLKCLPQLKQYQTQIGKEFNKNYANINEIVHNGEITHLLRTEAMMREFRDVATKNVELNINKGKIFACIYLCKKVSTIVLVYLTLLIGGSFIVINGMENNDLTNLLMLSYMIPSISNKFLATIDAKVQKGTFNSVANRIDAVFKCAAYRNDETISIDSIEYIAIHNLTSAYGNQKVLENITMTLLRGNLYYIQGESGCGKTTLLKILAKLSKTDPGMVYINDVDINRLCRQKYWNRITYLSQVPHIVKGTIRDNILINNPNAGDQILQQALESSTLNDSLPNFPNGLDTEVDGHSLSSGEKQKICLARALCANSELLLLDEAASALDPLSQQKVLTNLEVFVRKNNKIGLFITHTDISARNNENRFVLKHGKLI